MRHFLSALLISLMVQYSWAQQVDDSNSSDVGSLSAYDIFGLAPLDETRTSASEAETYQPIEDESSEEPIPGETESSTVSGNQESDDSQADEPTVAVDEATATTSSSEIIQSLEPLNEAAAVDVESLDVATADLGQSDASYDSADEEVLLAEVSRLIAERDELYRVINDLRAENLALQEQTADTEFYKGKTAELEQEIIRLESDIMAKNEAIAVADSRLAEMAALLEEEGARLEEAEARLASMNSDEPALNEMLAVKDRLIAEQDAVISGQYEALALKDDEIAALDRSMDEKDTITSEMSARLVIAEAELAKARADLEVAESAARQSEIEKAAILSTLDEGSSDPELEADLDTNEDLVRATEAVQEAEKKIVALIAERDVALASSAAAESARAAAEAARLEAESALAAARAAGAIVEGKGLDSGYLSGWKLDTARFTTKLREGFDGSSARLGSWKVSGSAASQTDASQYFSRLELPLAQGKATTLYRFKARSTGSGWVGLGLHLFVEDIRKKRGYGEGKSLLVWFTRDKAARGDNATYVQLYRSDDDVVMERMFDAELADGLDSWKGVEIIYDPLAEYIAVSVDGTLRIVYKTFFGREAGATVSLRTLGGGASFSDFSVWTE